MREKVRLPDHVKPERYKISLTPNFADFTFDGEETIDLTLTKPSKKIALHADELDIESAEYVNENGILTGKISYDKDHETATFAFPEVLKEGAGQLKLQFKGELNDRMKGFYRSKYVVDGEDCYLAASQYEATDARRAFPCFDEPAHKAVFEVSLITPSHMRAISNTIETQVLDTADGKKIYEFAPTPKMSTYLLATLVGEFEHLEDKTKEGTLVRIFTTPGKKEQGQFALKTSREMLSFYNDYYDIPYPLPAMDLIAVPDFAAGAMENWGAVTYRENRLLIDPAHSSTATRQDVAEVIAHEFAHMWFGDLVTMEWWTHLWLNEGFASFMSNKAVDFCFPNFDIWIQFVNEEQSSALALDSLENTHPIEVEVHHPREVDEIFDAISYAKGASILWMLEEFLGKDHFRDGIRHYLKKHQYSNAQTEDLWEALEEVSGKPVEKLMKNWTSKPGYPVIDVEVLGDHLKLTQSRFFSSVASREQSKDKTVWQVPLGVLEEGEKDPVLYLMTQKTMHIPKPEGNNWLKLNPGQASFIRVNYPARYLERLKRPIEQKVLGAPDRLGIIRDVFSLAEAGVSSADQALKLALSYKNEDDLTVWRVVADNLGKIARLIEDEEMYDDYKKFGRDIFTDLAAKLGWEKKAGEKHTDTLLRSLALLNLGDYGDEATIKKAKELFEKPETIDPDLRGLIYLLVAQNGGDQEYRSLLKLYFGTDLAEEKSRVMASLGLFKDKDLISRTLEFALSDQVRSQDVNNVVSSVWGNPEGKEMAWEFTKKNWDILLKMYGGGGHLLPRFVQPAAVFHSQEKEDDVRKFFESHPAPSTQRVVAQVLEKIHSRTLWLERDRKGIRKFLNNVKCH